jgi:hypothetical protein
LRVALHPFWLRLTVPEHLSIILSMTFAQRQRWLLEQSACQDRISYGETMIFWPIALAFNHFTE